MNDQDIRPPCHPQNTLSSPAVKAGISFGLAPAEFTANTLGCFANGRDRNGPTVASMGPPASFATPAQDGDQIKSSKSSSTSSSSKDPSQHRDGHKDGRSSSSSGHRSSSSSSSKPNGESSSKEHKHHSTHSSSSSHPKDSSSSSSKDHDRHKVNLSSSSSSHKDKDHSKSEDRHHHSSSHSKPHSSSSSGDRSHSSSTKADGGSSSSSSKPREDSSSKSKHSSSSSSSHKMSESKENSDRDRHHSKSHSDKPRDKSQSEKPREKSGHGNSKSAGSNSSNTAPVLSSSAAESGSNVSLKIDGSSIKMKIEMSPVSKHSLLEVKAPVIKTEPMQSPVRARQEQRMAVNSDDEDEIPLSERIKVKTEQQPTAIKQKRKRAESDDDSDTPLSERKNKKLKQETDAKKRKQDDDFTLKKEKSAKTVKSQDDGSHKPHGKKNKQDEEEHSWKWWEEEPKEEGVKWRTLEHKGPVFAALYEPLPENVKFYYDGKVMKLSEPAEEVAGFYARMLDHDYTTRDLFNNNFFKDWRKVMTKEERLVITDLKKCNFREYYEYFKIKTEERKNMSKEEKLALKKENESIQKEYGFCIIDGHKQKIGNFKIEPPGLFRGRGEHPKQGMLKQRVQPEDVIINCSKGSKVPSPPPGHKWKEVRHDNTVTWLASWTENVQGQTKYVMLNAASKLKGEKDWNKYETARKLHKRIDQIRETYREDWKSKEMRIRQRAVALYFIDKLALRAGNEKDEDTADTVGCCSLRVEHIKLHETYDDKECVVEFDFLGKDSIRYYNRIPVEKRVFKNLQLFMENKQDGDDLFDRLNTTILNKHLQTLMDGLTAKVFRTYNASHTLQEQLDLLSQSEGFADEPVAAKLLAYNRANRAVAILCNHQRAVPKNFDKQMENLQTKIDAKKDQVKAAKKELKDAKTDAKHNRSESSKALITKKQKAFDRLKEQLAKLEMQATDKDENKEIALSTSKLNYLDPRITVAWCKKWGVPVEKVYNKTQREKFAWAIDMATENYHF